MMPAAFQNPPLILRQADRVDEGKEDAVLRTPQRAEYRQFLLDDMAEGMTAGQFGGRPLQGNAPLALLAVLEGLNWHPDWRALASAMPHFPSEFGISEIRDVAQRLGYQSVQERLRGRDIVENAPACLVLERKTGRLLIVQTGSGGAETLRDPETGLIKQLKNSSSYDAVVFSAEEKSGTQPPRREVWSSNIWHRFTPELRLLFGLLLVSNLMAIAASFWIIAIFDKALPARAPDTLAFLLLGLGVIFALDLRVRQIRSQVVGHISGRLEYILGTTLFARLMSFPVEMVSSSPINDQINRLKQFETIRDFFSGSVVAVVLELPFLVLLIAVIFWVHPVLGGLATGLAVVYALIGLLLYPKLKRASATFADRQGAYMQLLVETFDRRTDIARAGLSKTWEARLAERTDRAVAARSELDRVQRHLSIAAGSTTPLAVGAVIIMGAALAIDGAVSSGMLVATTILIWRVFAPIQQGLMVATRVPDLTRLISQINAMMQINQGQMSRGARLEQALEPRLEIDAMSIRYPQSASVALSNIDLSIDPGSFIAVAGPTGAGKTTLLRALAGLYVPQAGSIRLGGTNIQQLDSRSLTDNIAYVSANPSIFHGTLAQNLLLAAPDAKMSELRAVAEELGYLNLVDEMPDGFQTRLDFARSTVLTPGLKSLIAISQAFLRSPGVILLDEPTADLSLEAEASLMKAIAARAGKTTIVMISHRESHLRQADQVLRLEAGRQASFAPYREKA